MTSPDSKPVNAILEVNAIGKVGNAMSETNSFAHGKYSSETVCVRDNFVRGYVVVEAVVGVDMDEVWVCVTMDEYV